MGAIEGAFCSGARIWFTFAVVANFLLCTGLLASIDEAAFVIFLAGLVATRDFFGAGQASSFGVLAGRGTAVGNTGRLFAHFASLANHPSFAGAPCLR